MNEQCTTDNHDDQNEQQREQERFPKFQPTLRAPEDGDDFI
jgi:hypothetical protein